MIRMTPQLAKALEQLDKEGGNSMAFAVHAARILAAYREAPVVEGEWEAFDDSEDFDGTKWAVSNPSRGEVFWLDDQRTAELYRDYLNAADAALEGT